jgi:hypothetical protein
VKALGLRTADRRASTLALGPVEQRARESSASNAAGMAMGV